MRDLRDTVDVIVVLGHQGLPGPMQTDAENDPDVQRPLDEDLAFCAAVPGIDVYIAAHSHHGLEQPIVHPDTKTLITQTYGYGTRVGRIRLADQRPSRRAARDRPAEGVELTRCPRTLTSRRASHAIAASSPTRSGRPSAAPPNASRASTDASRRSARSAPTRCGCARKPTSPSRTPVASAPTCPRDRSIAGHVLDAFPFLNDLVTVELPGRALAQVLEHGFSLEAGMVQASGLCARYDLSRPVGQRLVDLRVGDAPVSDAQTYRVATNSFLAEGGDGYAGFRDGRVVARDVVLSDVLTDYVRATKTIAAPAMGRLIQA